MAKILIVEDDSKIARFVELELRHEGYETETATDGRTGLAKALESQTDLVLLDIMLPELSGMEVCRRIRQESTVPVIMLTAKGDVTDKVAGLDMGANDYMTKPFAIEELLARIRVALKSRPTDTDKGGKSLAYGKLTVDPAVRQVSFDGEPLNLTKKEFDLLAFLLKKPRESERRSAFRGVGLRLCGGYQCGGRVCALFTPEGRRAIGAPFYRDRAGSGVYGSG